MGHRRSTRSKQTNKRQSEAQNETNSPTATHTTEELLMPDSTRPVRLCFGLILVPAAFTLVGCSSAAPMHEESAAVIATEHIEAPIRRLEAQSELEAITPSGPVDADVLSAFIPDGFRRLTPGSAEHQRAMLPLSRVLMELEPLPEPIETDPPTIEDVQRAKKLYVAARAKLSAGEIDSAIDDLVRAANLDPSSPSLFAALGDAYLDQGDRLSANDAYRQGIELGDRTPRALVMLATEAAGSRDPQTALRYAAAARANDPDDPMASAVASVLIGGILVEDGRLLAGASALTEALESFDASSRDPRWRQEIIQFHAQSQQLWMRVGDAWSALGAGARAKNAYSRAAPADQPIPVALVARQIGSSLDAGQPASAALIFLDHLRLNASSTAAEERQWAAALRSLDALGPVVPESIAQLRETDAQRYSSSRALLRIELASETNAERIETLATANADYVTPVVAAEALADIEDDSARYDACIQIVGTNPGIAESLASAMIRSLEQPLGFVRSKLDREQRADRLFISWMCIELGRADLLDPVAPLPDDAGNDLIAVQSQVLALIGDYAGSQALLAQLQDADSPRWIRNRARLQLVAQHPDEAWRLVSENANFSDASVVDLEAAARIALMLDRPEDARSYYERAIETDRGFEEGYEQLIVLHAPAGQLEDEEEHRRTVRALAAALPRSTLLNLIRVNELARNGALRDAENFLVAIATRSTHRDVGLQLLSGIWGAQTNAGDEDAAIRAERWFLAHLDRTPASIATRRTLAGLYVSQERFDDAIALLDDGYERTGSFELARAAEQILAGPMDNQEEAIERILARTSSLRSTDARIERAERLAQSGKSDQAQSTLRELIRREQKLLPAQRERFVRTLYILAGGQEIVASAEWLDLATDAEPLIAPVPFHIHRIRAIMLADLEPSNTDALVDATENALAALGAEASAEQRDALELICVQRMISNNQLQDALVLLHRLATRTGSLDEGLGIEIVRLSAGLGDRADATRVIDRLARDGQLAHMVKLSNERFGTPDRDPPVITEDQLRSETAYIIASVAQAFGRDEQAEDFFELALSYDQSNPWANNDYGYMLVEQDVRLDEAETMLERAVESLPGSSSILDSLGWARYKLGVLDDLGEREGALSILKRAQQAAAEEEGGENATIHEHLGDTLWRLERFEEAIGAWIDAERVLRSQLQQAAAMENPNEQAVDRITTQLRDLRLKITDAESERAPEIAPIPGFSESVPIQSSSPNIDPGK